MYFLQNGGGLTMKEVQESFDKEMRFYARNVSKKTTLSDRHD